ncbi:C45 family peptidase [Pikeienuella sp. HZG-20]|uniref:C45 family peptidase n=1 Tax=Paludibacillus litoralis TaxID=3133267 RepID=UPI0030EBEB63
MQLDFRGLTETAPGDAWRAVFARGWPGWRAWFLAREGAAAPRLDEAERALKRHMPEIAPLWRKLVDAVDGDDDAARFLSFWNPPRYLVGCSQLVATEDAGPVLIRNYDLNPEMNESTMLHTAWRGRRVMGMVDGLSGLADGVNDAGLAASLAFGGRMQVGRGFGVPMIMRYMLELCRDVQDAVDLLRRVPSHMSYNITVADRAGAWKTVFIAPDRPAIVSDRRGATNHQLGVEMPGHGRMSHTLERERHLEEMAAVEIGGGAAVEDFLRPPLFSTNYDMAFGTVYTAAYRPASGEAALSWRDGTTLRWRLDAFEPAEIAIAYSARGSKALRSRKTGRPPIHQRQAAGAAAAPRRHSAVHGDSL